MGAFIDLKDAMMVYKKEKIKYVQEVANKYKDYLSDELFIQMMNYEERFVLDNPEYKDI